MTRLALKNGHKEKTGCYDEIALCAGFTDTILRSILNKTGRAYVIGRRDRQRFMTIVYDNRCDL